MSQYGQDLLPELLSEIKNKSSFESACIHVFGLNKREIDSVVNQKIRSQYHFSFLLTDTFFWILILLLAISGFVATFLRKKKLIKEMELDEKEQIFNDQEGE
jgi:phosphotransferase system  glucose/maltose/N-acetylglucosamine-specific IIC component